LTYIYLDYHFFLNGPCPGLADIHPGEESTSKGLKFLVIGLYLGFQPCRYFFYCFLYIGVRLGLDVFYFKFHSFQSRVIICSFSIA
jgi:hypothetical protein